MSRPSRSPQVSLASSWRSRLRRPPQRRPSSASARISNAASNRDEQGFFMSTGSRVDIRRFASAGKIPPARPRADRRVRWLAVRRPVSTHSGGRDFKIVAARSGPPGYNFTPLIFRKDLVYSGK